MNASKRYKDIELPYTCPITNRTFNSTKGLSCYVTKTLKLGHKEYYDKYINHRDSACFFCSNIGKFISIGKGYRNLCENDECIKKSFNSHSIEGIMYRKFVSYEDAKILFDIENNRQLECRMEKFKEIRTHNPNFDNERCANRIEFWTKKGYTEEDGVILRNKSIKNFIKKSSETIKNDPEKYASKFPTKIEYYLKRGFSEEHGKNEIKKIQNRFSLDKCIIKYGEELGKDLFIKRQEKWQKSLSNNGNIKGGYSEISQILFRDILNLYDINNTKNVFYWTKNEEFYLKSDKSIFLYDFTDISTKKIIEYNGDQYHANPSIYNANEYPHPYHKKMGYSSEEIWLKDERKKKLANDNGFDVFVVWDSDYRKNPVLTLEKCIEFLK